MYYTKPRLVMIGGRWVVLHVGGFTNIRWLQQARTWAYYANMQMQMNEEVYANHSRKAVPLRDTATPDFSGRRYA